jgi:hypothetical protein
MDYSSVILNYLKDEGIKKEMDPLVYLGLKLVYNKTFELRSRYFNSALKSFFESLGNSLDISLFPESMIMANKLDRTSLQETMFMNETNFNFLNNDNLNITMNKDAYNNMSVLFGGVDKISTLNFLLDYENDYILDKDDDYILLKLIKNYLFSDEDPRTSQLMLSYNIFVSSVELIFCLKLVENFPKVIFNPREQLKFDEYADNIRNRIHMFFNTWCKFYKNKYEKNKIIALLIGNRVVSRIEDNSFLDLISLSMLEPLLNSKYISFTKLIREGPFCFEIEEVARQICIIDHEAMASLKIDDFNKFINKREAPESFTKFLIREKQIKCYILLFIFMQNSLENKKNMIQNFISLAHTCKLLNNQQTSYTIISAFNIVGLAKKKLLWKLIEKKYREVFSNLEKDFSEIELNEHNIFDVKSVVFPSVPHISKIKTMINNFIIRIRTADLQNQIRLSREYKEFYLVMEELCKNKYSFFKVNPLYDFHKFGFLEIFKPKKWNLKQRIDFSQFTDNTNQLDQLLDFLITNFKKQDN